MLAAVAYGGYRLIGAIGWQSTLRIFGIDVKTVMLAPQSQCKTIRANTDPDRDAILCQADAEWIRRNFEYCAKRENPNQVYVDKDGRLVEAATCTPEDQRQAREIQRAGIPSDVKVADLVAQS